MTLYEYFNIITGKGYVGKTKRPIEERDKEHRQDLRKGIHCNFLFQKAYDKYGEQAFKLVIRSTYSTLDELNKAEEKVIEKEKGRLYNLVPGGDGGGGISKPVIGMNTKTSEIKEYISVADTEKDGFSPKNIGGCCKLSVYKTKEGRKSNTNIRFSHRGWVWMYKKNFNLEEMERRRQLAVRGKIRLERPVAGKKLITGEVVTFMSGMEAKRNLNIHACITNACIFEKIKSAGGYVWVYADEESAISILEERYLQLRDRNKPVGTLKKMRPIIAVDIVTTKKIQFFSIKEMEEKGFCHKGVYNAISGKRKTFKGLVWFYKEGCTEEAINDKLSIVKMYGRRF